MQERLQPVVSSLDVQVEKDADLVDASEATARDSVASALAHQRLQLALKCLSQ